MTNEIKQFKEDINELRQDIKEIGKSVHEMTAAVVRIADVLLVASSDQQQKVEDLDKRVTALESKSDIWCKIKGLFNKISKDPNKS